MKKRGWTGVKQNHDFILVETYSGYNSCAADPVGHKIYLAPQASNEELGGAVQKALSASRILKLEELDDFFDRDILKVNYDKWVKDVIQHYGYKNRKQMFRDLQYVSIDLYNNKLEISPWSQEKLEAWGPTPNGVADNVIIPADSSSEDIGAALRLAFSRCTER